MIALAFGSSATEAGHRARASLLDGFAHARASFIDEWTAWQQRLEPSAPSRRTRLARTSAAVLRCHEEKRLPGAIIASLSIPWGADKSDEDLGGYHLVWPRDLVEAAGGLLAAGARDDALRVLEYLRVTQNADGSWPQNMWVDGEPYWHGIQLDETAFPILLVDLLQRDGVDVDVIGGFWPMVRRAAAFHRAQRPGDRAGSLGRGRRALAVHGGRGDCRAAGRRRSRGSCGRAVGWTLPARNRRRLERRARACIYVEDTELARRVGVDGYYVRIAPPETADAASR